MYENVWEEFDVRKTVREIVKTERDNFGFLIKSYGYGGGYLRSSEHQIQEFRPKLTLLVSNNLSPEVRLVSPNGGEIFSGNSEQVVNWEASDDDSLVATSLYYSTNSGYTWNLLDSSNDNTGSYSWLLPVVNYKKSFLLKIYAYDNTGKMSFDISDSTFYVDKNTSAFSFLNPIVKQNDVSVKYLNSKLNIKIPTNKRTEISVADIKGRVMYTFFINQKDSWYNLNSELSLGAYFITLKTSSFSQTFKILVTK